MSQTTALWRSLDNLRMDGEKEAEKQKGKQKGRVLRGNGPKGLKQIPSEVSDK